MKRKQFIVLIILLTVACCKEQKRHDNGKEIEQVIRTEVNIEKFDIQAFDDNKIENKRTFTLEDGTKIIQSEGSNYLEFIIPPKPELFITVKEYYKTGELKRLILRFPNDYVKIIKEYNKKGTLTKFSDFDSNYKLDIRDILEILEREEGKDIVDIYDRLTIISRDSGIKGAYWYVEYHNYQKEGHDKRVNEFKSGSDEALIIIEKLTIDDISGEIVKRTYYAHNNN